MLWRIGVLIGLLWASPSWAITTVISDNTTGTYIGDYTGTDDNQMSESDPTANNDGGLEFETSKFAVSSHGHTLIRFAGLSNITGPVTVTSVTFGLYLSNSDAGATQTIDIRRVLRSWNTTQATWNVYTTGNSWTTAGALSDGNDRTGTASGQLTSVQTSGQWYSVTQTTTGGLIDDVQGWINGTVTNNGWHLSRNGAGDDSTYRIWVSSDGTNGERPYLSVTYTVDGGSPITSFFRLRVNP